MSPKRAAKKRQVSRKGEEKKWREGEGEGRGEVKRENGRGSRTKLFMYRHEDKISQGSDSVRTVLEDSVGRGSEVSLL